ncbi:hypothetical protein BIFDEN_01784 [Bifidobacterium dentium ATCC 27678]|nr:hypothetical protein BIFDEN_01784 [Bifidobacterium dentium ATCC 27678]
MRKPALFSRTAGHSDAHKRQRSAHMPQIAYDSGEPQDIRHPSCRSGIHNE